MMYIAHVFTGAHVWGVYTTLDKAKAAVGAHFAALSEPYDAALWRDTFSNDRQHDYPCSEDGALEDVYILAYKADAPLEFA